MLVSYLCEVIRTLEIPVSGLSEDRSSTYFFFFAGFFLAGAFLAGAFFLALEAVPFFFAVTFFFAAGIASLLWKRYRLPKVSALTTGTTLFTSATHHHLPRIMLEDFVHVNRRMAFWKFFFKVEYPWKRRGNGMGRMVLEALWQ